MRRGSSKIRRLPLGMLLTVGCSGADLFTDSGLEEIPPDRLVVQGTVCTEDTSGADFPVKVLALVDNSLEAFLADPPPDRRVSTLDTLVTQNERQRHVSFAFGTVGSIGDLILPVNVASCQPPPCDVEQYFAPTLVDPNLLAAGILMPSGTLRDIVSALNTAESLITADMASATPGEILRSRYIINLFLVGPPNPVVTSQTLADQVERLKNFVYGRGALQFMLNVGYLYYGPRTIDQGTNNHMCYPAGSASDPLCPCSTTVTGNANYCAVFCAVDNGSLTDQRNTDARTAYQAMTFAGDGTFTEFPCPVDIEWRLGITTSTLDLVKKDIVAYNENVRLTANGPRVDSDGDGLTDEEELAAPTPTLPDQRDTDGDGLGDRLEFRTFPRQNPLDNTDRPLSCVDPAIVGAIPDQDFDLLNDCEEGLLQTNATVPDTDGDGLPDSLEFFAGTVPTSAEDRLLDFDADGIPNAEEVLAHTDPRINDASLRGAEAYRASLTDRGIQAVADMEDANELRGVSFREATTPVAGGPSVLRWDACNRTLAWSDARWLANPAFVPIPTPITGSGDYELFAESPNGERTGIRVSVIEELMPTCGTQTLVEAFPFVAVADRRCYDVRISNIKLMQTLPANGDTRTGINRILVFFTQAPTTRLTSPGISKVLAVPVQFQCRNPNRINTCTRSPADGIVRIEDSQFVAAIP